MANEDGAVITAGVSLPYIQMAELVSFIRKALLECQKPKIGNSPLFSIHESNKDGIKDKILIVDTNSILKYLNNNKEFVDKFGTFDSKDTDIKTSKGFISGLRLPPRGTTAYVGGHIPDGSERTFHDNLASLHLTIVSYLDSVMKGTHHNDFTVPSMAETMDRVAKSTNNRRPTDPGTATILPVKFMPNDEAKQKYRDEDICRVITAIETVKDVNVLESLCEGVGNYLHNNRDMDNAEIKEILEVIDEQAKEYGSQMHRFLEFMNNDAINKVRHQVSVNIMEAIKDQCTGTDISDISYLKAYIQRIVDCNERFSGYNRESTMIDAAAEYGLKCEFDLSDYIGSALFYSCLPVWPIGNTQLLDVKASAGKNGPTVKEISYRFKINGIVSKNDTYNTNKRNSNQCVFDHTLEQIKKMLFISSENSIIQANVEDYTGKRINASLAKLIFLYLVIPSKENIQDVNYNVVAEATNIAERLSANASECTKDMYEQLRVRCNIVDKIAKSLIHIMSRKSSRVITDAASRSRDITIAVNRGIIKWKIIDTMSRTTPILEDSPDSSEPTLWLKYVIVSQAPIIDKMSIISYKVQTNLKEYHIVPAGAKVDKIMRRDLEHPILPIRFIPLSENLSHSNLSDHYFFGTGVGIEILYNPDIFKLSTYKNKNSIRPRNHEPEQTYAASVSAFMITAYMVIWEIQRRIRKKKPNIHLHIARKHDEHILYNNDEYYNSVLYAIAYTIKVALAREGSITQQGIRKIDNKWAIRSAVSALYGGQPIHFTMDGSLDKVGIIVSSVRWADRYTESSNNYGTRILTSKVYTADRKNNSSTGLLQSPRMLVNLIPAEQYTENLHPLMEEISQLRNEGYKHVILLVKHAGIRNSGGYNQNESYNDAGLVNMIRSNYKDMYVYPMKLDVFHTIRLRNRGEFSRIGAFVVYNFDNHSTFYKFQDDNTFDKGIIPVCTIGTLKVVGENYGNNKISDKPQSGFCTYFFERIGNNIQSETPIQAIMLGTHVPSTSGADNSNKIRDSLISALMAIHFMESEKLLDEYSLSPVLRPFKWIEPANTEQVGEICIMDGNGRRHGPVMLSLPAVLNHVTKTIRKF